MSMCVEVGVCAGVWGMPSRECGMAALLFISQRNEFELFLIFFCLVT